MNEKIIARREGMVLAAFLLIFISTLIPSLLAARAEVRDGLRRQDVTDLKRSLEMYFNRHNTYPAPPNQEAACTSSAESNSWLFTTESPLIREGHLTATPHDVRESQDRSYRYCVTETNPAGADGYFIEAVLERHEANQRSFDEDEQRKFHYRILNEGDRTLYRVCGGAELQCQLD